MRIELVNSEEYLVKVQTVFEKSGGYLASQNFSVFRIKDETGLSKNRFLFF